MKNYLLISFLVLTLFSSCSNIDYRKEAYKESVRIVEDLLKAPSTAKFQPFEEITIHHNDDDTYTIHSYVDSQNSFSAMIRSNYSITLQYSENNWIIKDFIINGKHIKNSRAEKDQEEYEKFMKESGN